MQHESAGIATQRTCDPEGFRDPPAGVSVAIGERTACVAAWGANELPVNSVKEGIRALASVSKGSLKATGVAGPERRIRAFAPARQDQDSVRPRALNGIGTRAAMCSARSRAFHRFATAISTAAVASGLRRPLRERTRTRNTAASPDAQSASIERTPQVESGRLRRCWFSARACLSLARSAEGIG